MLSDTLQNVDEIVIGTDLVHSAGGEQALYDPDVFGAEFCPGKEPIASSHGNNTRRSFQMVRVHRNIRVLEKDFQPQATLTRIAERLREGVARQQALTLKLSIDPGEERLHPWFAVSQSMLPFALTAQILLPYFA